MSAHDWPMRDRTALAELLTGDAFAASLVAIKPGLSGMLARDEAITELGDGWYLRFRLEVTNLRQMLAGAPIRQGTISVQLVGDVDEAEAVELDAEVSRVVEAATGWSARRGARGGRQAPMPTGHRQYLMTYEFTRSG